MNYLFDTHLLLWAAATPARLPPRARGILEDGENDILFSVGSIWEVAIKNGLGRDDFQVEPALLRMALLDAGYRELPISGGHVTALGNLPPIHRDPFDRLFIAQAMVEGIALVTADPVIGRYSGPIIRL